MGTLMENNSADTARLLEQARAGDQTALNEIFARHRARLRRMVELRLDRQLQARIDASDVVQEAYVEAVSRLEDYLREPSYPLFLWLRLIIGERLLKLHRHHRQRRRLHHRRRLRLPRPRRLRLRPPSRPQGSGRRPGRPQERLRRRPPSPSRNANPSRLQIWRWSARRSSSTCRASPSRSKGSTSRRVSIRQPCL